MALQPTQPNYNFATGDLARVRLGPAEAVKIIMQYMESGIGGRKPDPTLLLAALLRQQRKKNLYFYVTVWSLINPGFPGGYYQQILDQNLERMTLQIFINEQIGFPLFLFENGPKQPVGLSVPEYNAIRKRAVFLPQKPMDTLGGSPYNAFFHTPINPVTVVINSPSTVYGTFVEGV